MELSDLPHHLRAATATVLHRMGFGGPAEEDLRNRDEYQRQRRRRSYTISIALHLAVILGSMISLRGCLHEVPKGVPGGKGNKLPKGEAKPIRAPKVVRRKRRVRKSPVKIHEMMDEEEEQQEEDTRKQFSDSVGVPGAVGEGAAAAGSPRGTALGGKLYFYRIKFNGPNWNANSHGVSPLMQEVLRSGVVKKVSGYQNPVSLKNLPKHSGKYLPALVYMTGTGPIRASGQEIKNMREYLKAGGMLFADNSGGQFHKHFVRFIKKVLPKTQLREIEFDHEIFRGDTMPYAMLHGCPIYRRHRGAGPALGMWIGPKLSVFYSRGDLGAGWAAGGLLGQRKRNVEKAFRMGVNIVSYSLYYYRYTGSE